MCSVSQIINYLESRIIIKYCIQGPLGPLEADIEVIPLGIKAAALEDLHFLP